MKSGLIACGRILCLAALLASTAAIANDVDGPNDCERTTMDLGDAPEGFAAYPGVIGHFPTCTAPTAPGDQSSQCAPISTAPGATGCVVHINNSPSQGYWLGCPPAGVGPQGIDSETDAKTSAGSTLSACAGIPVDCIETTPIGNFGQDECFGDDDAGLLQQPNVMACTNSTVQLSIYNCGTTRQVMLNILLDMNQDGDWNDNFTCTNGCAQEWALKNVPLIVNNGCNTFTPSFLVGPNVGYGWMRISISDNAAPDDYPWNGSVSRAGGSMTRGETEDYLVQIKQKEGCSSKQYFDFGDAPEGVPAYASGVVGRFPTCLQPTAPGTQDINSLCPPPISAVPGSTGYVEHVKLATTPTGFWFGCTQMTGGSWVDGESDGKVNLMAAPGQPSTCAATVTTDCVDNTTIPGMSFGQDECFGDNVDAGLITAPVFDQCDIKQLSFQIYNCSNIDQSVYLNILVDWNADGDWNDVVRCERLNRCADEWAVVNYPVILVPGCNTVTLPAIQAGPNTGHGWMRCTLTGTPVALDFPWNGSASEPGGAYMGGETEDYPAVIQPSTVDVNRGDAVGAWFANIAPNPAAHGAATHVRFGLRERSHVALSVFDVSGRRVRTLVNATQESGLHAAQWDAKNEAGAEVAPGVYFLRLDAGSRVMVTARVTRLR